MDIFTQNKLLMRLIILLALLNVASIGVFVWKDFIKHTPQDKERTNGRPPRPEDFKDGRPPRPEDFKDGRPPRPEDAENRTPQYNGSQDVSTVLEKELHLTKTQVEQIQALRTGFFKKEQLLRASMGAKRDSMNELMFNKLTDETVVKALARGIAEDEYQMELLRLEQAQTLKSICTPEQLARFNDLVIEIRDYFQPHH
jgi:Spy/CpxP family protein refolding chaperone